MKYIQIITIIILTGVSPLLAQENEEYSKWEIYGGYSAIKPANKQDFGAKSERQGYEVSVTRNLNHYLGLKFDHSGHLLTTSGMIPASGGPINAIFKHSVYNFTGGLQLKDHSAKGPIKPFVHALFGVSSVKLRADFGNCPMNPSLCAVTNNVFTMIFGGGLDLKVHRKFSLRPLQVDYVRSAKGTDGIVNRNNIRLGAGIVFQTNEVEIPKSNDSKKYSKYEIHAGYSYNKRSLNNGQTLGTILTKGLQGYNSSIKWNFQRFLGVEFEHSAGWAGTETASPAPTSTIEVKRSFSTFAGGLQVKDNASGTRLKPFGHALFGAANEKTKAKITNSTLTNTSNENRTDWVLILGGGLDVKVKDHLSVRVFQFDYLRNRWVTTTSTQSSTQYVNYYRFGAGIVFH